MRLVNIGAGEMADRLSILALKIAHGEDGGKDTSHFRTERNAILVQFRSAATDAGLEHLFDLAAVNAMLWHAEDDMRDWRGQAHLPHRTLDLDNDQLVEVAKVAFRIQSLNDQRAELVWTLNKLAGTDLGKEKL